MRRGRTVTHFTRDVSVRLAAMDLALRCIATGDERILVLAGTIVSKGVAFHDPMHRAIFGDGAGVCVSGDHA